MLTYLYDITEICLRNLDHPNVVAIVIFIVAAQELNSP
jgi:hypothetical protein